MPFNKKRQTALTVLSILLILILILYIARIYSIQVANADKYSSAAKGSASTRVSVLKASRGEILDRFGRQIAINRDGYNIVFNKAYVKDNLNDVILSLVKLMKGSGCEYIDKLPLQKKAPYDFNGESTDKLLKTLDLAGFATSEDCFRRLVERYKLEDYKPAEQRAIMAARYGMDISDFSLSYPYTFAEDISTELMRKISELGLFLDGVSVDVVPFRKYTDTSLAVNLIGTVGPIYEEDWGKYKKKGYSFNDKVGKSGIELWAEKYLHGTDGEVTYYIDSSGNIIDSKVTKKPVSGKTVVLTLDSIIQRKTQDLLKNAVLELQGQGGTVTAASAVIIDVENGGVICGANYPTYDSAELSKNYNELLEDKRKPLTDRAFQGVYPIGSTIKPIVATAALETGKYHLGDTVYCSMVYNYFKDYKPKCMHYHGTMNLKTALAQSCNYFFFDLGRRVGATTLTDYFKQFGLGVKTGVEVDDSAGIIINPETDGLGGNTLQISIGQLNAFTPLQMANYVATFANGGTHYRATLISKIVSYDLKSVYNDCKPEIVNKVSIKKKNIKAIKEGMLSVTVDGTGRAALGDYPIKIGGKTGTSQTNSGADHSTFIVFAPYDNPKYAISLVLEHGHSSFTSGNTVKNILDFCFFSEDNFKKETMPYTVLD
ncbi:MAG: hypothetical protein J5852_03190 [Clostridia bacterium]|nr:hypothetical protein [Clostridia bacterium]